MIKKYPFLNEEEQELLVLISKSGINRNDINHMSKERFNMFLDEYVKCLKKNSTPATPHSVEVTDFDVDTLFYLKKNKISIKKVLNKLSFLKKENITNYPNIKKIYSSINSKFVRKKVTNTLVMVIAIAFMMSSALSLNIWNKDNKKTKKLEASITNNIRIDDVKPRKDSFVNDEEYDLYKDIRTMDIDFNKLLKMNSDTKGWVYLSGTTVNYPFVQYNNNEYYLEHDFNKKPNQKGWVFMDFRNNIDNMNKNTILYAHGLITEKMFGGMRNVFKNDWLKNKDNHIIKLSTKNKKQLWRVFSIYKTDPEEYYITTDFDSDNEYNKFIDTIKGRSEHNFNVKVDTNDKILALSSCYSKGVRMVVHAKLISTN